MVLVWTDREQRFRGTWSPWEGMIAGGKENKQNHSGTLSLPLPALA